MAPHSSTLAWKIPWMEEPGRLQSMGSRRVGHDWATSLSLFTFMHWRRKWQPTPVFLPGESQDGGAWWAAVYGVAQSRTLLKCLSTSSSSCPVRPTLGSGCPLWDPACLSSEPQTELCFLHFSHVWALYMLVIPSRRCSILIFATQTNLTQADMCKPHHYSYFRNWEPAGPS